MGGLGNDTIHSGGDKDRVSGDEGNDVIYADAGKQLRLSGGLGPLQDLAVTGVMTFAFTEANGTTTIDVTYKVGGYMVGGLNGLAKPVDGVVAEQVMRLKQYVDSAP